MEDPPTESEQFKLRSELGALMRIARIARPGSLYGASASAQTFEAIQESVVSPSNFNEIADVNLARAANARNYPHIPGFEEYGRKSEKGEERRIVRFFLRGAGRVGNRKPISKFKIWCNCRKRLGN